MEMEPLFNQPDNFLLKRMMDHAMERQRVIANNLANANTPGFIRREVDFKEKLAAAVKAGASMRDLQELASNVVEDHAEPKRLDGGNVSIPKEMSQMMENGIYYELLSRAFNTKINILKAAIARN